MSSCECTACYENKPHNETITCSNGHHQCHKCIIKMGEAAFDQGHDSYTTRCFTCREVIEESKLQPFQESINDMMTKVVLGYNDYHYNSNFKLKSLQIAKRMFKFRMTPQRDEEPVGNILPNVSNKPKSKFKIIYNKIALIPIRTIKNGEQIFVEENNIYRFLYVKYLYSKFNKYIDEESYVKSTALINKSWELLPQSSGSSIRSIRNTL